MRTGQLQIIINQTNAYVRDNPDYNMDPYGCYEAMIELENLECEEHGSEGFTRALYDMRFGWKHLQKADPKALYPYENSLNDYEHDDKDLLNLIRSRDNRNDQGFTL